MIDIGKRQLAGRRLVGCIEASSKLVALRSIHKVQQLHKTQHRNIPAQGTWTFHGDPLINLEREMIILTEPEWGKGKRKVN